MNNCLITSNSASWYGGGAYSSSLTNCTVVGNSAGNAGGAGAGTLANCIVYYNAAPANSNHADASLSYCCAIPLPASGDGNLTNDPGFFDPAGGNFRLQTNSPCINAGNNAFVSSSTDLDGGPRIVGGTVDIGAYESGGSVLPYCWLQQYGLPTDGSADFLDTDGDSMNNWQEWTAGTNPTNNLSALRMLATSNSLAGVSVSWKSVSGKTYYLQRGTNLFLQPGLSAFQSNIVGQADVTSFTDASATNAGPYFYRVGVQ
jgi:hypothetical protein